MKSLYVFDLDGTLLDVSELYKKAGREPDRIVEPEKHKQWIEKVIPNTPMPAIRGAANIVKGLSLLQDVDIIFLTGRSEKYRKITEINLNNLGIKFSPMSLFMRSIQDNRHYAEYKEEIIKRFQESYSNVVVFEDDPDNTLEAVCKRNNWTLYKSMTGGYEKS